jgi:hypothetical protein
MHSFWAYPMLNTAKVSWFIHCLLLIMLHTPVATVKVKVIMSFSTLWRHGGSTVSAARTNRDSRRRWSAARPRPLDPPEKDSRKQLLCVWVDLGADLHILQNITYCSLREASNRDSWGFSPLTLSLHRLHYSGTCMWCDSRDTYFSAAQNATVQ